MVQRLQLESDDERVLRGFVGPVRGVATLRRPSRSTATQRRSRPATAAAGETGSTTSSPSASDRADGQALRHRVGDRPIPGAAAQRGGRLGLVGARAYVELPGAEFGEHRSDQRLTVLGLVLCTWRELVAARRRERITANRPYSVASSLSSVIMSTPSPGPGGSAGSRCCPTPPWTPASSASGPRPLRLKRCASVPVKLGRADDVHQHVGALLVEPGRPRCGRRRRRRAGPARCWIPTTR